MNFVLGAESRSPNVFVNTLLAGRAVKLFPNETSSPVKSSHILDKQITQ